MNIIKAECQNCHATLNIDLENMIAKCPYCGGEYIIYSNQLSNVVKQKEKTKRFALQKNADIAIAKNEWKNKIFSGEGALTIYIICMFLALLGAAFFGLFFDNDAVINRKLNRTESKILEYITNNQYDKALSEINKLDSYQSLKSKSDKKLWKEKFN